MKQNRENSIKKNILIRIFGEDVGHNVHELFMQSADTSVSHTRINKLGLITRTQTLTHM